VTSNPTSSERRREGCCANRPKPRTTRTAATAGAYITTAAILGAWAPAVVAGLATLVVLAVQHARRRPGLHLGPVLVAAAVVNRDGLGGTTLRLVVALVVAAVVAGWLAIAGHGLPAVVGLVVWVGLAVGGRVVRRRTTSLPGPGPAGS